MPRRSIFLLLLAILALFLASLAMQKGNEEAVYMLLVRLRRGN